MTSVPLHTQPPPLELSGHECGGQILRAALTLAAATGRGFVLRDLRAGHDKPGLLRRHLAVVRAAADICDAQTQGAELSSTVLTFLPGKLKGGAFTWAVGAAGNANLVLQTVLPALTLAPHPATVTMTGGTHTPSGPPFCFLSESWLPQLRAMGATIELTLDRWGFFPAGRGRISAQVTPSSLSPVSLVRRGPLLGLSATAAVAVVNPKTARMALRTLTTELTAAQQRRDWPEFPAFEQQAHTIRDSCGPGNILWLRADATNVSAVFSAVLDTTGGSPAGDGDDEVGPDGAAAAVASQAATWLDSGAPVEEHLAASLVVPMALAGSGRFVTTAPTEQLHRVLALVERFLPVRTSREVVRPSGAICVVLEGV